ncbi:hsp70-binding protein 1-like [Cydia strobilella]|uniref:hsp70-binding protein 1-like n=1 Tax=Cydia strobilella TaxID=1100964 RepID=UPI0030065D8F
MASSNPGGNNPIAGAPTFPSRSEDVHRMAEQPRQPRNLQGLLRFAMEATKAEDAPGNSELGPMDEERKRFLEDALKSLTVDVAKVLQDAIAVLSDADKIHSVQLGQSLPNEINQAFTSIMDFIDDIDTANDFYKLGGFSVFPVCYGSENEEIRTRASGILAELCQNNPFCQSRALESGLLNVLLALARTERGEALAKCVAAISCTCREYPPSCRELVSQGGCDTIATVCGATDVRARTKAALLARHLCDHYPEAREKLAQLNLVKTLAEQLSAGRDASSEHLLNTLLTLLADLDERVLAQCRDPGLGLKGILERHLKHPELKDDTFREEVDYCQEILCKVFLNRPDVVPANEEADR